MRHRSAMNTRLVDRVQGKLTSPFDWKVLGLSLGEFDDMRLTFHQGGSYHAAAMVAFGGFGNRARGWR